MCVFLVFLFFFFTLTPIEILGEPTPYKLKKKHLYISNKDLKLPINVGMTIKICLDDKQFTQKSEK